MDGLSDAETDGEMLALSEADSLAEIDADID